LPEESRPRSVSRRACPGSARPIGPAPPAIRAVDNATGRGYIRRFGIAPAECNSPQFRIRKEGKNNMKRFAAALVSIAILCGLSAVAQTANPATEKKQVNDVAPGLSHAASQQSRRKEASPHLRQRQPLCRSRGQAGSLSRRQHRRSRQDREPRPLEQGALRQGQGDRATVVRIPVHPIAWRRARSQKLPCPPRSGRPVEHGPRMYVDIDWHSIGNLKQGLFQDPMYETSLPETFNFWRTWPPTSTAITPSHSSSCSMSRPSSGPARIDAVERVAQDQRGDDLAHPRL